MGWASYIEDICHRFVEHSDGGGYATVGPAGTPPVQSTAIPRPPPTPPLPARPKPGAAVEDSRATLRTLYRLLRSQCRSVGEQVIRRFRDGDWRQVAVRIDWLKADLHEVRAARPNLSENELHSRSEKLLKELEAVSQAAGVIIEALDRKLSQIQETVDEITVLRDRLKPSLSPTETETEQDASWLLHGWKTAKEDVEQMAQTIEHLEVEVHGELFLQMLDKNVRTRRDR
jgi:hypothetical protein